MGKIDELIEKLCPNGVKKYKLFELVNFENGKGHEKVVEENGKYILITSKAISTDMVQVRKTNSILSPLYINDIAMVMSDLPNGKALAKCFLINENDRYTLNQRVCKLITKVDNLLPKYLYYYVNRNKQLLRYDNGVDQTNLRKDDILNIDIAVPPLEVQNEIVSILDDFTELLTELSTELKLRQKQYEYYRDKLLNFEKMPESLDTLHTHTHTHGYFNEQEIKCYKLGEIVNIYLGLTHTPKYVENGIKFISAINTSKDYLDLENVKYINEKEYNSITDNAKPKRGDILFTRVGSNLGHPVIVNTDEKLCIFVSLGFLRIKDKNLVLNSYLKHWINTKYFWNQVRKNVHGSAKVNLNTGWLCKFEIFLPPVEIQEKIVSILDRFEKLCNDISYGLPAEIKARQKQYEYYRDKLLNFKELKVS